MINLLKQAIKGTWRSMVATPWMYALTIVLACVVVVGLVTLVNKFLPRDIVGRRHFFIAGAIICKFLIVLCELCVFNTLGWITINSDYILITALILEVIPYICCLLWELIVVTICYIVANVKKHNLKVRTRKAMSKIKTTIPNNLNKSTEEICVIFTRNWIKSHIEQDKTRYATLANHKADFITQLSAELAHVCDVPTDTALTHYNKCVKSWKK